MDEEFKSNDPAVLVKNMIDMDDEEIDHDDDKMEVQDDNNDKLQNFKKMVMEVLEDNEFMDKRSLKLDIDDFLKLLLVFNQKNIHFK